MKMKGRTFGPTASQEGCLAVPEECFWLVVPGNRGDSFKWQALQILLETNKETHSSFSEAAGHIDCC